MSAPAKPAYAFPASVLAREVDGEMVLLDLESEQYYGLDPVGADMVTRLTTTGRDEAVQALTDRYEVDHAVLVRDVDDLVTALVSAGLLQPAPPA